MILMEIKILLRLFIVAVKIFIIIKEVKILYLIYKYHIYYIYI
jgi:hypothetical protein